jgi:hypothetical protein
MTPDWICLNSPFICKCFIFTLFFYRIIFHRFQICSIALGCNGCRIIGAIWLRFCLIPPYHHAFALS